MPWLRESPYSQSSGDRPWPSPRPVVERDGRLPVGRLSTESIHAPHARGIDLVSVQKGDRVTVSRDAIIPGGAPGEHFSIEQQAIAVADQDLRVIEEEREDTDSDRETPEGDYAEPFSSAPVSEPEYEAPAPSDLTYTDHSGGGTGWGGQSGSSYGWGGYSGELPPAPESSEQLQNPPAGSGSFETSQPGQTYTEQPPSSIDDWTNPGGTYTENDSGGYDYVAPPPPEETDWWGG